MSRIIHLLKNHRRIVLFLADMLLWNLSYYLSLVTRKNHFLLGSEQGVF